MEKNTRNEVINGLLRKTQTEVPKKVIWMAY